MFHVLSHVDLEEKLGREYVIFGSVAVSNGHVYLQAANKMYCIGAKDPKVETDAIPELPKEQPLVPTDKAMQAWLQVVPADAVMRPGEKRYFRLPPSTAWDGGWALVDS